jgi:hypothetical protein
VTLEAVVGKQRPDVAVEVRRILGEAARRDRKKNQEREVAEQSMGHG